MCVGPQSLEESVRSVGLELPVVVSHQIWELGIELRSSGGAAQALNH